MRVLDTDVCIEILRGNQKIIQRRKSVLDEVVTTWITAAELYYGASKSRASAKNQQLVSEFLATLKLVGLDTTAVKRFGTIKADLEQKGQQLADADLLIAAIVLAKGATLVTGNRRHYQRLAELAIEDWMRG